MEDEALLAIEKTEQQQIAVQEIDPGTQIQRRSIVGGLQPQRALVGRTEEFRHELPLDPRSAALELVARESLGIPQVLLEVEQDALLLRVLLDQPAGDLRRAPAHVDARVLLVRVELATILAEQF